MGSTQSTWGILVQAVRMSAGELGCTYAALILHDDGQEVTEEKMKQLLNAAKVECEAYWPSLFCRALASQDMNELLTPPSSGAGAAVAVAADAGGDAGGAAGGDAPAKKKSSSDDDGAGVPAADIFGGGGDDY